ncbi:MAG: alpha/beta hydrolase [Cyanobacteria bacterium P01_A01_bin.37]
MPHFLSPLSLLAPVGQQLNRPLFLFLPGMDGTGQLLNAQIDGLKQQVDIRCVVLPATSQSWDSLSEQTIQAIYQEQQRSGPREVYLCGESFGACLALHVISKAPEIIHRLILVNPATAFRQFLWSSWVASGMKRLPDVLYPLACSILLPFLANLDQVTIQDSQALLDAMRSVGYPIATQRVELLSRFDISDDHYRRMTQPTLILAGGGDRLLPSVDEAYRLASLIPNVHVHPLPNSGHTCLLERDVNLAKIMKQYQFGCVDVEELSHC